MYVIGTAGHVDHGKSTLVETLTGIDPDRWAEEKEREMTIDLGFAWLALPGLAEDVGVIDVPGHRDFIENMLAGVGGIDLALLVVAADEGVMPQTREHLAILDLLQVARGVVALTKTDLIDDPDWLELVELDLAEALTGTVLADAPIVPVSARSGAGLDDLRAALAQQLLSTEPRVDMGQPRLPIDRVFTIAGFGTIVTGTLVGGTLRVGDSVTLQPAGLDARVRGLQSHKTKLDLARPGRRLAVNLTGVDRAALRRGDVLAGPGVVRGTILCDVEYRHLPDADKPLKHNAEVKLFVGAAEIIARARVLGQERIAPGESGWLQLALREPAALVRGDRFILRRPSPGETIGGGRILDPHPGRRHRRFRAAMLERLETLARGTPDELLLQTLHRLEPVSAADLLRRCGLDDAEATAALEALLGSERALQLGSVLLARDSAERHLARIETLVAEFHAARPLRPGMPREELRSRLRLPAAAFNPLLERAVSGGRLVSERALVRAAAHAVTFTPDQQRAVDDLLRRFAAAGVNAPSVKEARSAVGDDVYAALLDLETLYQVNAEVVYPLATFVELRDSIVRHLQQHGSINAAEVRDIFQTSRKYAIGLLEHLDELRLTRRVGDARELAIAAIRPTHKETVMTTPLEESDSIKYRRRHHGLISVRSKVQVRDSKALSLVYTPGVAEPCLEIARHPERSFDITCRGNTIAIVSDGSTVYGLGDVGPEAVLPLLESQAIMMKNFAGVDALPLALNVHTVDEFVDTVINLAPTFGAICVEDVRSPDGITITDQLEQALFIPVVNNHREGVAVGVLGGLINAARVVEKDLRKMRIVINGAGSAGLGTAFLLHRYGVRNMVVMDREGAIYPYRPGHMNYGKWEIAHVSNPEQRAGDLDRHHQRRGRLRRLCRWRV